MEKGKIERERGRGKRKKIESPQFYSWSLRGSWHIVSRSLYDCYAEEMELLTAGVAVTIQSFLITDLLLPLKWCMSQ